jgi:hypothetical protein
MTSNRFAILLLSATTIFAAAAHAQQPPEPGQHPHHRPPPAAFDACKGKNQGEACSVTFHEHTMNGTCATTPESELACRPDHPPPGGPPPGEPPQ